MTTGEHCPVCGGEGVELGVLGSTRHFCCRDCGLMFWKVVATKRRKQPRQQKPTDQLADS